MSGHLNPSFPSRDSLHSGAVYFGKIRPLRLTARQASLALGAEKRSRTIQRLIHAATTGAKKKDGSPWLIIAQWGGRGRPTLIDTASFEAAYAAMLAGEEPPLLPSEVRRRSNQRR